MEAVGDAALRQSLLDFPGSFHDEDVVAVGVVGMTAAQPLIDENGALNPVADRNGDVQGRVFVIADGVVHPVEHVSFAAADGSILQDTDALLQVRGQTV